MSKEVIAIDLGGTHLRTALVKNGKILKFTRKNTPRSKEQILKSLIEAIKEYSDSKVKRVGISCAGTIENNIIKVSPNLPLKNVNLKKEIEKKFKLKVKIENDANCVALAEAKYGVKKRNFFILTLGTGIGGGIIIDRKLYKGKSSGGELGHIIINGKKDFEYNFNKCKTNKKKMAEVIGQGISSLISVFDPEIVVLAGGVTKLGSSFLKEIRYNTKKYMYLHRMPEISFSKLEHPGTLGASLLFD